MARTSPDLHLAPSGRSALRVLEQATESYLESLRGGDAPTDELEFRQVHDSVLAYERSNRFHWQPPRFPDRCRP